MYLYNFINCYIMRFNKMQNGVGRRIVLRRASLYVCLTLLSGMAFPLSSSASPAIEIAQQNAKQITGTVSDAGGTPIIGANVVQAGTTNGTIADVDGKFALNVPVAVRW